MPTSQIGKWLESSGGWQKARKTPANNYSFIVYSCLPGHNSDNFAELSDSVTR